MRNGLILVLLMATTLTVWADDYAAEIDSWHRQRVKKLTKEDGWLTLVGLHWLRETERSFSNIGEAWLEGEDVVIRPPGTQTLVKLAPHKEGSAKFENGSLSYYVIRRGSKVGLRVKDKEADLRTSFPGIERFPVDAQWRLKGRFVPDTKKLSVPSVAGVATQESSPGWAVFEWRDTTYRVRLMDTTKENSFFLVFRDASAGKTTYGACRFLYVDRSGDSDLVLDFNKAVNPPCAFTNFATCPLPFRENILPFEINAGEKKFDH